MKNFLRMMALAALLVVGVGCESNGVGEGEPLPAPELEVTPNNISGTWQLSLWNDAPLAEGSYVYIDFVRADRTYTMYQNVDSFGNRTLTGRYYIYVDEELGVAVIRGDYDHGAGEWNHRYIVESLTAESMRLVAKDNSGDVCTYVRAELPEELLATE